VTNPNNPVSLSKVTLTKAAPAVSLAKQGGAAGILRVNLNWAQPAAKGGLFKRKAQGVDLDLGCLYEYSDGSKGVVQALGDSLRDVHTLGRDPICRLDGDDRSGTNTGGENLFVDLRYAANIRRILVFAFIYEGTPNWAAAQAVVTLFPVAGPQLEIHLDEQDPSAMMCAIAMIEGNGTDVSVRREVRYVRGGQRLLDETYGWGMRWAAGRK
jgi:tellurite resistance protein TerA